MDPKQDKQKKPSIVNRDDSANQPEKQKQLEESKVLNPLQKYLRVQAFFEESYERRQKKEIKDYTYVTLLTKIMVRQLNDEATGFEPVAALFPGQIGYTVCHSNCIDSYEVCFIDTTEFSKTGEFDSEDDVIIATNVRRNQLLVLYSTGQVNDRNEEFSEPIVLNAENPDLEQQNFYNYVEKSLQDNIIDYTKELTKEKFYNNLKPHTMVTIISDFILEKDENQDNVEVKLYAGEIGIILDPDSGYIQSSENSEKTFIKNLLNEDEVMIIFPKIDLWNLIRTQNCTDRGYVDGRFEPSECRIVPKTYLLPLFTTKLDANFNKKFFDPVCQ
jgi:hypothetical protein